MNEELAENSLLSFENYNDFINFYKKMDIYKKWRISSGTMNSRGESVRSKEYSLELINLFKEKNMFRRKVSIAEIVSWLDSFKIIDQLFVELEKALSRDIFNKISIYSEYVIKMSKKMRIDYVFKYQDKLLIIELRMVSNFDKIRPTWEKKKLELIIYKDLLTNYVSSEWTIINYALIILPEYDIHKINHKHIDYNMNQINYLKRYIIDFLILE